MKNLYCNDLLCYKRRETSVVHVGNVSIGGGFPIQIQSMTNTNTSNTTDTVKQIVRIAREGADLVRVTVPGTKDAENLTNIMAELAKHNCHIPIVADIHFNPKLARMAAGVVHKVRVNPGNFVDKKSPGSPEHSEVQYQRELEKLRDELKNLLVICRKHDTAIRIGTNHGSLSERIVSRYGDSPEGMAESAMEFLRICVEEKFTDVVVSMKASNTRVMVFATRLLVQKMEAEGMHFPLHLGVTEAGEGEDGRIKSAVGIGALLADGIGETIRISLTEDPELEIPVARSLVEYFKERASHTLIPAFGQYPIDPFSYTKRDTQKVNNMGAAQAPVVLYQFNTSITIETLRSIGWQLLQNGEWAFTDQSPDYIIVEQWPENIPVPQAKGIISTSQLNKTKLIPIFDFQEFQKGISSSDQPKFVRIQSHLLLDVQIEAIMNDANAVIILETDNKNGFADQRAAIFRLMNKGCINPVVLRRTYNETSIDELQLKAASDLGGLFIDGLAEGIWVENNGIIGAKEIVSTAFGILQASRVRTTKTEYISCPSCGRTLFDLQSTTRKIREQTAHLKGLKIGIMGCIVNGPGEMADADYGYVGTGMQRVTLYKGQQVIKRNIPETDAVEQLIELIKEHGDWVEP